MSNGIQSVSSELLGHPGLADDAREHDVGS
jgi:hypothetical protein